MLEKILKYVCTYRSINEISLVRFIMIQSGRKEYLGTLYGIGLITVVAVFWV